MGGRGGTGGAGGSTGSFTSSSASGGSGGKQGEADESAATGRSIGGDEGETLGKCATSTAVDEMLEITRRRIFAGVRSSFWWRKLVDRLPRTSCLRENAC